MNAKHFYKTQKEIRRRAFQRYDTLRHKEAQSQATGYTLDALQELTGLPRVELETIAHEVAYALNPYGNDFFSVKHQVLMVLGTFGIFFFLIPVLIRWFF
jgi:hypothetical protein